MYVVEPFLGQSRASFDCGEDVLNRYLRERVTQDTKRHLNRVFIARHKDNDRIVGFYTLAVTAVLAETLPPSHAKKLPHYPLPAALLGKLAVDKREQGKGVGKALLTNAVRRVQMVEQQIGLHVLVVDPLSDSLVKFYAAFGFLVVPPERRMFLFMDSLPK